MFSNYKQYIVSKSLWWVSRGNKHKRCNVSVLEDLYLSLNVGERLRESKRLRESWVTARYALQIYIFRGVTLLWLKSFMSERMQIISSMGILMFHDLYIPLVMEFPRILYLTPILFHSNDLPSIVIKGHFTSFADDSVVLWRDFIRYYYILPELYQKMQ